MKTADHPNILASENCEFPPFLNGSPCPTNKYSAEYPPAGTVDNDICEFDRFCEERKCCSALTKEQSSS